MKLIAAVACLAICSAVYAAEAQMTADEQVHCQIGGGCLFVTQDWLRGQIKGAYDAGRREEQARCKRPTT